MTAEPVILSTFRYSTDLPPKWFEGKPTFEGHEICRDRSGAQKLGRAVADIPTTKGHKRAFAGDTIGLLATGDLCVVGADHGAR